MIQQAPPALSTYPSLQRAGAKMVWSTTIISMIVTGCAIVGHDTVDHARATHYRVTIDLLKAVAAEPTELRNADTMADLQQFFELAAGR